MGLRPTKGNEDAGLPRGDCLRCPKRSAMRFQLVRQWTLRAVPGRRISGTLFNGAPLERLLIPMCRQVNANAPQAGDLAGFALGDD